MREQFLRILTWCYNTLRNEEGLTPDEAFQELNKLLYLRYTFDERKEVDIYYYLYHATVPSEYVIGELFLRMKEQYQTQKVFDASDKISVREETLFKLLGALRDIDFYQEQPELGEAYEDYISRVVKSGKNRAIIPLELADYIISGLRLKGNDKIVNPYCGYGGMLTAILNRFKDKGRLTLFAMDTDRMMAQTTLLNMMLHGAPYINVEYQMPRNRNENERYDVMISVLPYKDGGPIQDMEELIPLLKQNGRAALVVPDSILNQERYGWMRHHLIKRYTIRNITSLPIGTIRTGLSNTLKMSILFIENKGPQAQNVSTQFIQVKSEIDLSLGIQKSNFQELCFYLNKDTGKERKNKYDSVANVKLTEEENWDVDAYFAKNSIKAQSAYTEYRLGDILRDITYGSEEPEEKIIYKLVTVRSKQHDVVLRERTKGEEIKTRPLRRIREGQLLISRIGAKDGAIGIVPKELDGALVSGNFLILDINKNMVLPYYLVLAMTTKPFKEILAGISTGITKRSWLRSQDLLECRIPLPDLYTQQKLVEDLVGIQEKIIRLEKKWEAGQEKLSKMIYGI